MSNWISSKLKVAENLLHQIDQQAAGSLKKNEKQRSDDESPLGAQKPVNESKPLLKDQLKKKPVQKDHDLITKSKSDYNFNSNVAIQNASPVGNTNTSGREKETVGQVIGSSNSKLNLTDSDWTELLSVPSKTGDSLASKGSNGVSGARRDRRDGKRQSAVPLEVKKAQKDSKHRVVRSDKKSDVVSECNKVSGGRGSLDGRRSEIGDESRTSSSSRELRIEDRNVDVISVSKSESVKLQLESQDQLSSVDVKQDVKRRFGDDERSTKETTSVDGPALSSKVSGSAKRTPLSLGSPNNEGSDSESGSSSSSGSESEGEREEKRKRMQQILAEKAAAKATEAIKERENNVAKLEGEKQSLEKILEEQAKQQVLEASELQTTMMETMDAVDVEKQKHKNTRMEALARLAELETTNADLARSLASVQKTLELEINRVTDLRRQIELKEAGLEESRRKISSSHNNSSNVVTSKGVEFERDILEAEYSFSSDKVGRLQDRAKTLETSINATKRELEHPTEVEMELKRRLGQLTDHLIQKQAQVESLSSEKALLLFKIEAASRSLDENKAMLDSSDFGSGTMSKVDLESGIWEIPKSKFREGKQHFGSLVLQLDSIYCAGAVFLRRNSRARLWSMVYLVCLHLWVLYIFMSHSLVTDESTSGAVVSLQNINSTGGGS